MRKRQRTEAAAPGSHEVNQPPPVGEDAFITDHDAVDSAAEDDDDDEKPKSDKKAGRRKIKIEFIQDKSRRHITFSKRKAGMSSSHHLLPISHYLPGIMKKVTLIPVLYLPLTSA